jgi:hypothetical protein
VATSVTHSSAWPLPGVGDWGREDIMN